MKKISKKSIVSLILAITMVFNMIPFGALTSKVYAETEINEIRLISSTTSVQPGTLPEFSVSTTTEHVSSIDSYGSNTCWNYKEENQTSWRGFSGQTPTATEDGTTHYGLRVCVNLEDGYKFSDSTKIYFNGEEVTTVGSTELKSASWGGYVTIDLGTAGKALEVYTIAYDSNGGTGTMASHTATQGVPEKLRPCTFTPPAGKVFASWEINGVSGYKDTNSYTFTSDTTVKAIWKDDNYIRISNATMTPSTITSDICANDLQFTSSEPDKYSVAFWRVYDFTDDSLNTTYLNEYPHDKKFIAGHVYSIEMEFTAVAPYEYDVSHSEYGSKFYIDGVETMMSKAVDLTYSTLRRIERTAATTGAHTVTFNLDGGTMSATNPVVVNDGEKVSQPTQNPTKAGCTFGGWFAESTFSTPFDFNTPITIDGVIIYAKWIEAESTFDIIYDFNGGNRNGETSYVEHSVGFGMELSKENLIDRLGVTKPEEKELEAVMINGSRYELGSTYILNANSNIQYLWKNTTQDAFTVTFELNYNSPNSLMTLNNLASGSKVNSPNPDPTRGGYSFGGWFKDQTCTTPFDFENDTIITNTIIYAKWNEESTQKITFQLDNATVSGNVITFQIDDKTVTATVSGTGYTFNGNKLEVNLTDINNVKLTLDNNFDASKMCVQLHDGQMLAVNNNNEVTFGGLNFENDNAPHLMIQHKPAGGSEDIGFELAWTDTYIMVSINDKEVLGDSNVFQNNYSFTDLLIENAGETDANKTNIIRLQNRFGDKEVSEYTINGVKYNKNSNNVEITKNEGWFITVPGAAKYVISATGDSSIPTPKTIIWVNPDYVPENEEDAKWVSDFTVSHGTAKVVEVYDENGNLLDPDEYTKEDEDEFGLNKGFGWVRIMPGSRVVFEFVPEYGYQLTGIAINETPLDAIDSQINRFEIELPNADGGNLHFAATFTKTEDIVKADSKKVSSGEITLGNNLESGSAQLTVNDVQLSSDKIKGFENAAGDYTISNYLDIDLYNIFYKGKNDSEDVWSNKIDELEKEATITLKLADGLTADDIVIVHNVHDGDKYEIIKIDSYNPETNTITFKTKSFSNYAIATKTSSAEENNDVNDDSKSDGTTTNTSENTSESKSKENDTTVNTKTSTSPKTGDKVTSWIAIMGISAIGFIGTYIFIRKRK